MKELLKKITQIDGVSGCEQAIRDFIINEIKDFADEIKIDRAGNLLCFKAGNKTSEKKIMYAAHMDEVGFYINSASEDGLLYFDTVGINTNVLLGKSVVVGKDKLPGVIGAKPIHLLKETERESYPEVNSLYIDIGALNKSEVTQLIGSYAVFDSEFTELGDCIIGKAFDDRVGCAVLCQMLKGDLEHDSYFAFTVGEEIGARGACAAVNRISPDICIVVEGTTAQDVALNEGADCVCHVGQGAVVPFMDGGTYYDIGLYSRINKIAAENNIKIQTKTLIAGGTDAQVIQKQCGGIRVAAVSLPCRYIHSGTTVAKISDVYSMKDLLEQIDINLSNL